MHLSSQHTTQPNEHTCDGDESNEKLPLLQQTPPPSSLTLPAASSKKQVKPWRLLLLIILVLLCVRSACIYAILSDWDTSSSKWTRGPGQCVQVDRILPIHDTPALAKMNDFLLSSTFRNESVVRLSGAIQIKSESFDDMGSVKDDNRWNIFYDMAKYMDETFPLVKNTLQLEKINSHGLLYTWQGTDRSLKPTVLMAHQDVVPVARSTQDQWTHDAFGGYYDGKYVWGRGSSDCKNSLVGIMEAVEYLIQAEFKPKRTLVLSFGFDEEISGKRGAHHLARHLVSRYKATGGAAVILDEGAGVYRQWGGTFAVPGVAEKGYVDVEAIVRMPGGHSSIPPPHTGIGVASELISAIEAQPYKPQFYPENPIPSLLQCAAVHGPDFPKKLKKLLPKHAALSFQKSDKLAAEVAKLGPAIKYLFTTSQATDIIQGGVKNNALPERTRILINHRINVGETSTNIQKKLTGIAASIAQKHNLTLHAFDDKTETPSSITLSTTENTLEPAPVTPTDISITTPYSILAGTLRALYGNDMIVAPGMMTGNTDTRYYWDLSKHIFRYGPGWDPDAEDPMKYIHTVNEKISMTAHVRTVQWYSLFIRNMDEAELD